MEARKNTNLPSRPTKNSSCCFAYTESADVTSSRKAFWNATISSKLLFNNLKINKKWIR